MEWWQIVLLVTVIVSFAAAPFGVTMWRRWPGTVEVFRGNPSTAVAVQKMLFDAGIDAELSPGRAHAFAVLVARGDLERARSLLSKRDIT